MQGALDSIESEAEEMQGLCTILTDITAKFLDGGNRALVIGF